MRKIFMAFLGVVLLLSMINPAYNNNIGEAATDNGETKGKAIPLTLPTKIEGNLEDYGSRYYKATIPDNGELTISVSNMPESSEIYVWDEDFEHIIAILESDDGTGTVKTSMGLAKGKVIYIVIEAYEEPFKYDIQLDFKAKANLEKEPNDTIVSSQQLNLNTITSGYLKENSDYSDHYKFILTKPGKVTVKLSNSKQGELYLGLTNVDEDDYDYLFTNPLKSGTTNMEIGLPAGTYYMSVSNNSDSNELISYQLELNFTPGTNYETESNDKKAEADPIKLNSNYQGFNSSRYDNDVYTFTLTKKEKLKFSVSNTVDYLSVENGEKELNYLFPSDTVSGTATKTMELVPDTYYVRIDGRAHTAYNLKIQTITPTLSTSKITVKNNYGKNDTVTVSGIQKGNQIKVYDKSSGGKLLASQTSAGTSTALSIKQLGQKAGKIYVTNTQSGYLESSRTAVSYKAEPSAPLKTTQVKITNNRTSQDVIAVSGIKKGDTVKVYDKASGGKLLVSKNATGTSLNLTVKQLSQTAGKIYVTNTQSGYLESSRTAVSYKAEPSAPLKTTQVKITNNRTSQDVITVSGIKKGDNIKVYDKASGGKLLVSKKATGTSLNLTVKQLTQKAGKVYVSVTKTGLLESSRVGVSYKAEPSAPLKASQLTIKNNKGKSDTITVKSIQKGDTIKVYTKASGGKLLVSKKSAGTSTTLSVKQLGKNAGSVYISVTKSGLLESSKVKASFKKE
ncbi:hypothetical protein CYL18_06000 [Pradoshia eiseniae]|uniref:Peptidase C-terminal archaeal/bacterial domain-containing protein n=1 Tax=Pradoshia eiseniae TaxID=2064768 RepID=A0A2S7N233_9BACI|nr:hypothetical protein [Pradoshia eiseniae]PQD96151.1 hypothetical protein CYL18_06000 [Pradoshia eiseniae]